MSEKQIFSRTTLSPTEVPAGDSTEFIIRLVVGPDYPDQPTRIVFDCQDMLGTSCPNARMNEEPGYVEAYVSNPDVTYTKSFLKCGAYELGAECYADGSSNTPLEGQRMIQLDLSAGLTAGDVIEVHWGETLGGFGPGTRVTHVVPRPDFRAWIDVRFFDRQDQGMPRVPDYEGRMEPAPSMAVRLHYRVTARDPHRLRLLRQAHKARLIPYDLFWNVVPDTSLSDLVTGKAAALRNPQGVHEFSEPEVEVSSRGLPLTKSATMYDVHDGYNLYWGDLHAHSKCSYDCLAVSAMDMTPAELMVFARDRAALDFFAVADHNDPDQGPHRTLPEAAWDDTLRAVRAHNEPGRFVVFPGFEKKGVRGEAVVIFKEAPPWAELRRVETPSFPELWSMYAGRECMTIPHFHNCGGLDEGIWQYPADPLQERVLEIYSDHGSFEREEVQENGRAMCKAFRSDRSAAFLLRNGYRYGFAANSDDHKGHVGVNGLTAVFAKELTRDAIWEAYRQRRVYATTNARIRLIFTANGCLMGSELPNSNRKRFLIDVRGENELKKIDLFRNGEPYQRFRPRGVRFREEFAIDDPEPSNWYVRVTQHDNHLAWSSPVWFD